MAAPGDRSGEIPGRSSIPLAEEWRALRRAATIVALLTAPAFFLLLWERNGWNPLVALFLSLAAVIMFRGLVDVIVRRLIPWPNLYNADQQFLEEDVIARRRAWYWRKKFKHLTIYGTIFFTIVGIVALANGETIGEAISTIWDGIVNVAPFLLIYGIQLPLLFLANFLIFFGPLLVFGLKQMKGYEPGDADWGVKLEDVRGQKEAKEEVRRVIALWQSGEAFEKAGGKRERGLLFLGAPGTGKTMLSKAIATGFNCPFVTMPGSGFAQTFIGLDVVIVMFLIRKAKKLAAKWGGQCIVFIDEIDAVGMRRNALGGGAPSWSEADNPWDPEWLANHQFYGRWGARNPTGDMILETRAWRERLFASRATSSAKPLPQPYAKLDSIMRQAFPGGGMFGGYGMALNQLLVQMDGIDEPPFFRKFFTNRFNTFLDALYIVPQKIGGMKLRLPKPKPRGEQVYFIGATNVPIDALDPALIRPGRMGRHIWFRTPTKDDRKDIFDLYLKKVDHDPELDTTKRRDELSRMTNGYSPAMIEQVCSMALTYAHSDGRPVFERSDLVEAMTTVESGTAQGIEYVPEETRSVAIHEAGHAAASHLYMKDSQSTRLSIRKRGSSLGHHQAIKKDEQFVPWRHQEFALVIWGLGAMAAERVFYNENSTGVGGDVESVTATAAYMVGYCAMGPEKVDLSGRVPDEFREEQEEKIMERFERIGNQIMQRGQMSTAMQAHPVGAVLGDPGKRRAAAQILGQGYLTAYNLVMHNQDKVEQIAEVLIERREMHGDEVLELLERARLKAPEIDLLDEAAWPKV
ncbi:MAG TPA: AAA family ATPase [Thermoleophilaceae bacterium]|jgi:ATP-dependent Zn protease